MRISGHLVDIPSTPTHEAIAKVVKMVVRHAASLGRTTSLGPEQSTPLDPTSGNKVIVVTANGHNEETWSIVDQCHEGDNRN